MANRQGGSLRGRLHRLRAAISEAVLQDLFVEGLSIEIEETVVPFMQGLSCEIVDTIHPVGISLSVEADIN